ncbi:MAG TPA: FHA domain-containing protein, partial [Methylibium sp.]|nr:FHA domain-containing protein [Methylibium sp.]
MRVDTERLDAGREPAAEARPAAPTRPLAMIELLDRDGAVAHRIPVRRWPVTIGRAIDCDVVLDDPHAAPHHATIDGPQADAPARLVVGPSVNGARLA